MRLARRRIFARLREGWDHDEIAREERLAPRIRRIVRQVLERRRIVDEGAEHAKLQLARRAPAMPLAGQAISNGDVTAIAPLLKVLDPLDRYRRAAEANQVFDDEPRENLPARINLIAANPGVGEARDTRLEQNGTQVASYNGRCRAFGAREPKGRAA